MGLKRVVEETDTKAGRRFDNVVLVLILVSLVSFSLESLPGLPQLLQTALGYVDLVVVLLFTVEYVLRIAVADSRVGFIFSFFGLVDLAAILPFYLSLGVDLRTVRLIRLFRIVRVFKLARYNSALRRLRRAALIAREELVLFLSVMVVLIYLAAVGIYYFERPAQPEDFASVFHSLWWAVVTLTSVGYGDVVPVTAGGRLFTIVILILTLGVLAVPTALVSSALQTARDEERTWATHDRE